MNLEPKEDWNNRLVREWESWIPNNLPEKVDALTDDELRS